MVFPSNANGGAVLSARCFPAWSLGVVFVGTVVACLVLAVASVLARKRAKKRRFRRTYRRNSGMVTIGRRGSSKQQCSMKPWRGNGQIAKTNIPDIKIGVSNNTPPRNDSSCDSDRHTSEWSQKIGPGSTLHIPSAGNLSLASGVYAQVDASPKRSAVNLPATDEKVDGSAGCTMHSSLFDENSYFTPVFRPRAGSYQREFPTPGILDLSKKVRMRLASSLSTPRRFLKFGSQSGVFDGDIAPNGSVASLHEVVNDGSNKSNNNNNNNNCTYLTFNDVSVIITPPISKDVKQSVEIARGINFR